MNKYRQPEAWMVLNNAKVHKSQAFKRLTEELNLRLIFNAVATPQGNLVEFFFEYTKRQLCLKLECRHYEVVAQIIDQARKLSRYGSAALTRRQRKALHEDLFAGINSFH